MLFRPDAVTAVEPGTGELFWSVPYEATNGLVVMSPIKLGDHLFVGGYSDTNMLIKLPTDKPGAEVVWRAVLQLPMARSETATRGKALLQSARFFPKFASRSR